MRKLSSLAIVSVLYLVGCKPGPVDPPLEVKVNRVEVKPSQWELDSNRNLQMISAPQAWQKSSGRKGKGKRVVIASIGTGVDYTNPDLRNALWMNTGEISEKKWNNGFDDDGNGYIDDVVGYDFFSGDGRPYDWHGHDSFTAGVMVAAGQQKSEVQGVAPNAAFMVLRYLGPDGRGNIIDAYSAFSYAIENGADIIYFNWPSGGFQDAGADQSLFQAVEEAGKRNILVVIPSGNSANQKVPGFLKKGKLQSMDNVIIVSGLGGEGRLSRNTNYGKSLSTIAAPAAETHSFLSGSRVTDSLETSSVAAAYVAGGAALLRTQPGFNRSQDIRDFLLKNSRRHREPIDVLSEGIINLAP